MDNMLKDLWLYVSNVVYFIFAMLFIWIALMNIIGQDGDNYKLKQAIPKFIV
jgi:F0F1-type ATP synthase membrane subunit a